MLKPATKEAYDLLHLGALALSRIEEAGLRIDVPYLDKAIEDVKKEITTLQKDIESSEEHKVWVKTYGDRTKLGSREQLGKIIFDILGHKRNPFMRDRETERDRNNVAAFEHLKLPFVQKYHEIERLKKALSTNLLGIKKETVNGYCHPFQSLDTAESYRSSSRNPNFHNQPIRNKRISKIVRSSVIPRKNHVFLEPDLNTHEVRVSYCYNKDPKLRYDIENGDMHADRAKDVYLLSDKELDVKGDEGKLIRYTAKNRYVFAGFYGSYYKLTAPTLWDAISLYDLKTSKGLSLFEHLKSKGIERLGLCRENEDPEPGTFEALIRDVDRKMWEETYTVYNQWKKDWWELYQKQGGVNTLTGFCQEGVFRRNQILCDSIQGSAFHCELWTIIQAQRKFRKYKMKSKIVDQVHDSLLIDTHKKEVNAVREIILELILEVLPKYWSWIIIPLSVGFDIGTLNWYDKKPLEAV